MDSKLQLAEEISRLVVAIPNEVVLSLAKALGEGAPSDWSRLHARTLRAIPQPAAADRVRAFLDSWHTFAPEESPERVSLGLLAAAHLVERRRQQQRLDLVWTGPETEIVPMRRTDQALLQLINGAQETLHIVSFAVYNVKGIASALVQAASRGVTVSIFLETPDASQGRIAFDTIGALGDDLIQSARIYIWPLDKRPKSDTGRHGSLHAKVAVADGKAMLVSSANLTRYAMTLNMEMGLLVHGGPLPAQVVAHLHHLVEERVFELV